ncbi:glycosyltransferase (probably involved in cell wall biogenesis) [Rubidibacter lacunae KORDI 51-2]|uniref:Glycosyltransferase (Probably involved in cell wall biogenesis) n=1 Tax=Rubidibacter lacunae KORDI 51-2 TaxID=582515 RepID=U5DDU2_9CHRO|nr:glycosyltransferase family 2 protein [Rubidibacter lacunae]ERN42678.1 glycosyltransferase (probably involved in cell wall biogenesis) [Rubidibacter lacunae KORDI 51-2]
MVGFLKRRRWLATLALLSLVVAGLYVIPEGMLLGIALVLAVPCTTIAVECSAALAASRSGHPREENAPDEDEDKSDLRYTVIVPAHNEATIIERTLAELPVGATLVIADNCTDSTAEIARNAGFQVLERHSTDTRGKGFAIEYGLRYLESDPPEAIVIIDADCRVAPGAIAQIARRALATKRPVQSLYLLDSPASPSPTAAVSAFAFLVKNRIRPMGLAFLGLPCLLQGSGMAFPWESFAKARLVGNCIVEDIQFGIDLAIAGTSPLFCSQARVTGLLPSTGAAAQSQRTRWEHGHMQTILTQSPRLLRAAITQRRLDLLALALEVSVPPLSLLGLLWAAGLGLAIAGGFWLKFWLPAVLLGAQGVLMGVAVLSTWAQFGRDRLPLRTLLSLPLYLFWKVPLYLSFVFTPQQQWIRTPRDREVENR